MAKVTKFVYITIHFLSLFFIAMNIVAIPECHADSHRVAKIDYVLTLKPQCRNYTCVC
ncbi:Nodule Cysteine-Rich (NCR) secreted peptide [Medicago truncatula]|uniref:Nodule Cysteine-Rich (NCR) secreted peptide n=1 Tax=Medicago truncatula TaxID=3880 RepID=A0A072TGJ1_MEDTR|nr:Nodule Cysteine-Rich (NCR) secreted peptide [Medicago truncatula]